MTIEIDDKEVKEWVKFRIVDEKNVDGILSKMIVLDLDLDKITEEQSKTH